MLSQAGIASRRKSAEIIEAGRVEVNGKVVKAPGHAVTDSDVISVDGKKIASERKKYFAFHKPVNVITTARDEAGRKCVADFFKSIHERVFSVGRLDRNTSGLLLVTNDGKLANGLTHPKHEVEKVYLVVIDKRLSQTQIKRFQSGIPIDGKKTAPCSIRALKPNRLGYPYEVIIHEGRNRQIRNMMIYFECKVKYLHRHQVGPVSLGNLPEGKYRELKPSELKKLMELI